MRGASCACRAGLRKRVKKGAAYGGTKKRNEKRERRFGKARVRRLQ